MLSSCVFFTLLGLRYIRVAVHLFSYYRLYKPSPIAKKPIYTSRDVTVILATVGAMDAEFEECLHSLIQCGPLEIIISTVGRDKLAKARDAVEKVERLATNSSTSIRCITMDAGRANRRHQTITALAHVKSSISCLCDDHIFWGKSFLPRALAPFEIPTIGLVGTSKRVRRNRKVPVTARTSLFQWVAQDFLNYLACIYLERHNFECTATNAIDGGVFVISSRCLFARTSILKTATFEEYFGHEMWCGSVGPLNVDDDNCITRHMVNEGWGIKFQNHPDCTLETNLGVPYLGLDPRNQGWEKFHKQLGRWARTTFRSNYTSLVHEGAVWRAQPWCVYAVFLTSFVNFALVLDALLFLSLWKSGDRIDLDTFRLLPGYGMTAADAGGNSPRSRNMICLAAIILGKVIEPHSHWIRKPRDLVYVIPGVLFGWYHSFIKLNALLTVTDVGWSGRSGVDN